MDDLGKQTIKGYELRERIGAGGFGAVYRAYQPVIEREVAIKVILPEYANQPDFIRRFEAEAQVVARLEHPHIVPLYDYWREPDGAYLVMRWLREGNLQDALARGPFDLAAAARLLDQITAALALAHHNGVVHRDLKPANILLDKEGNAYLTDFGISKVVGRSVTEDSVSGSLHYISPEQLKNEPPTHSVDIYSLGIVLFEVLTGHHPFAGETPSQMVMKHLNEPLPNLSDERPDLPPGIDAVIQKATAKTPGERYAEVQQVAAAFRLAIAPTDQAMVIPAQEIDIAEIVNPYKGLRAFQEADADDFFGREALVQRLIACLSEDGDLARFLAVVGPSGSGKSSVVRAGLVPALWGRAVTGSDTWFIVDMVPGAHPLRQLEAALLSVAMKPPSHMYEMLTANESGLLWAVDRVLGGVGGDLLLIVDQFEELFTLVEDEAERAHFLALLHAAVIAPDSRLRVVITLRADFTDRPLEYVDFGELIRQRTEFVLPLSADEIERAITGPATRVGLQVDTDLVAAIVADVREEPGALPLLQYALTEVFERRETRNLTLASYQASGGVLGALARRAEEVYGAFDTEQKALTRQLFLRLITLGEGTEDTRRRARRSELSAIAEDRIGLETVLDAFGQYRLLAFDSELDTREPTVDIAHEALIREWEQLRAWLDDSRADVRLQRLLAGAAAEWRKSGQDPSYLLSGARLVQFEEWSAETDIALTDTERDYILASVANREQQEAEEMERQVHERELERRSRNRLRGLVVVMAVAIIIALGLSALAFNQSQVAQDERNNAVAAQSTSDANAEVALNNAATATFAQGDAFIQAETAVAAQVTSDANAEVALNNAATATIAQGDALIQARTAVAAQATSNANAEVALNNAATATFAQGDALAHAETAVAAQATSNANAEIAGENAATATFAQGDAQVQAATAVAAQATSNANAEVALNNAATATFAQGDALIQAETAVAAQATSNANAEIALNNAATATIAQGSALLQAATATFAQGDALVQAETAVAAQATSVANAALAADNAATADANAILAEQNAATAVVALDVSEISERLARAQALAASADQLLDLGDVDLALALALESASLNPELIQAQQVLNRVVNVSPVLTVRSVSEGYAFSRELYTGHNLMLYDRMTGEPIETNEEPIVANYNALFSPDGRHLLTVDNIGNQPFMWDIATGERIHRMEEGRGRVNQIAFSQDGRYIVAARIFSLAIYDVETGQLRHQFARQSGVVAIAMHPDGTSVASGGGEDAPIILWNIETGEEIRRFAQINRPVKRLAFSPDGSVLYSWSLVDGTGRGDGSPTFTYVEQWNVANGNTRLVWDDLIYRDFNRDGSIAWTGGGRLLSALSGQARAPNRGELTLRYPANGGIQQSLVDGFDWRTDSIRFIDFSPDGRAVLVGVEGYIESIISTQNEWAPLALANNAGTVEHRVVVIDLANGAVINRYVDNNIAQVTSGIFASDSETVLSTTADNRVILWRASTGEIIREIGIGNYSMVNLGFSPDERYALTLSSGNTAQVWQTGGSGIAEVNRIPVEGGVRDIAFSPDEEHIYAGSGNALVIIDRETGEELERQHTGNVINSVAFSPTQPQALVSVAIRQVEVEDWDIEEHIWDPHISDPGGRILLWNLETGESERTFGDTTAELYMAAYSSDGHYALLRNEIWDLRTGNSVRSATTTSSGPFSSVFGPAISPDTHLFVVPSGDRYVRLIPIEDEEGSQSFRNLRNLGGLPTRADFSPDSSTLLVGISRPANTLILAEAETGDIIRQFIGHTDTVNDVVFSPDGLMALSASDDGTLILWDVATGQPIRRYTGHNGPVRRVVFSSDGRAAISSDGAEIIEWRVDTLETLQAWIDSNLHVHSLSCAERDQYNVRPLCDEVTVTPTPAVTLTPSLTPTSAP